LSVPRAEFEEFITSRGGTVAKTVTRKVTHLVRLVVLFSSLAQHFTHHSSLIFLDPAPKQTPRNAKTPKTKACKW
jgi:hypothetical protein